MFACNYYAITSDFDSSDFVALCTDTPIFIIIYFFFLQQKIYKSFMACFACITISIILYCYRYFIEKEDEFFFHFFNLLG